MANLLKLRLGVSERALQPTLHDCLEAMLGQADLLMTDVLQGLTAACDPSSPRRVAAFQKGNVRSAVLALGADTKAVCQSFREELTRIVYEGGGKEQVHTELLRFEDLQLFEDAELDQSIEVARAQQEVSLAVDDVLPLLDSLMSTLLGWRTIQPGLNPLRPDVYVRALQACLSQKMPDTAVRESLITPAAGLLGANLRKLYRELADWLRSGGIEPAVPIGGKLNQGSGASGTVVADSVAKTLLTLDRLRKLLSGDFDAPRSNDFLHTVPASMAMLQDMKQVDALVRRLEERPKADTAPPAETQPVAVDDAALPRLGHQLGQEVVRLMFDNLGHDSRLMTAYKQQLKKMEPAVFTLAQHDSRFFSDRTHPARQFLDRVTQRSLAFSNESDEGWSRFLGTLEDAARWLDSKVVDADVFGELLDQLQAQWTEHDQVQRARREEAARALLHAEQRNLLAQKLAADFAHALEGLEVAQFVGDFLKGSWSQVVAEAQLSCADGSDDPYGYRAVVDDLIWSVQKSTARRGRGRRLAQMIPGLLAKLREGLERIDYPPELTARFFENLVTLHHDALQEGRDAAAKAAADAIESAPPHAPGAAAEESEMWLASREAQESGYLDGDSFMHEDFLDPEPAYEPEAPAAEAPATGELRTGTWVELMVGGAWLRVQLTWASPHATLFMFTSLAGTAHSMSRRTLDRLRTQRLIKVVADRNVVDEALDQVAKAALKNSLDNKG
ncbi:MAG: DUF1631 family protein [Burkholderiales bacterium]|nr:DUF1631 family protein [Burkholderiales bacterium]